MTNTAAAAATISWVLIAYAHKRKVSVLGAACGAVAGLVAITPASGFVTAGGALVIGLVVGVLCYGATLLRERLRIDDALDVFSVHGVGGVFGALATGDRIVDNTKVRAYLDALFRRPGNHLIELEAGHAVQFERPDELATALLGFIAQTAQQTAALRA